MRQNGVGHVLGRAIAGSLVHRGNFFLSHRNALREEHFVVPPLLVEG